MLERAARFPFQSSSDTPHGCVQCNQLVRRMAIADRTFEVGLEAIITIAIAKYARNRNFHDFPPAITDLCVVPDCSIDLLEGQRTAESGCVHVTAIRLSHTQDNEATAIKRSPKPFPAT